MVISSWVRNTRNNHPIPEGKNLLSRKAVAAFIGVSVMTIKRYEQKGMLHPLKLSERLVRYRPEEIERFLEGGQIY